MYQKYDYSISRKNHVQHNNDQSKICIVISQTFSFPSTKILAHSTRKNTGDQSYSIKTATFLSPKDYFHKTNFPILRASGEPKAYSHLHCIERNVCQCLTTKKKKKIKLILLGVASTLKQTNPYLWFDRCRGGGCRCLCGRRLLLHWC